MDDAFVFYEEDEVVETQLDGEKWNILIVDDEETVHSVTKLVLDDVVFDGKNFNFISARNEREAYDILDSEDDIAVILLDVVMDREDSGLRVVEYIRNEKQNLLTRIILRTGMPGNSPEREIINKYDINDYKTKVELTSEKLYTTIISSLRAYRDLKTIHESKIGLKKIIIESSKLLEYTNLESFANGISMALVDLLHQKDGFIYIDHYRELKEMENSDGVFVGIGKYESVDLDKSDEYMTQEVLEILQMTVKNENTYHGEDSFAKYYKSPNGSIDVLYFKGDTILSEFEVDLLELFTLNILAAYENVLYKIGHENN